MSGRLELKASTFKSMAGKYTCLSPLREVRDSLGQMRLMGFEVGEDQRNRCLLSPFGSSTSRNQPSSTKFLFGSSVWLRGLIKPSEGRGLAYIDYCEQEFGIAAALSGDENMKKAYRSGDPYLELAKLAGVVPRSATKKSHPAERALFKATVLAVQYGMGPKSLGETIHKPLEEARYLLRVHRRTFSVFWKWVEEAVEYALIHQQLWTTLGWRRQIHGPANVLSLANFPMQANAAEILRLSCILMFRKRIRLCAPIHDAVLIEAPLEALEGTAGQAMEIMAEASSQVLAGFVLETDATYVHYSERYCDEDRGRVFWGKVTGLMEGLGPNSSIAQMQ